MMTDRFWRLGLGLLLFAQLALGAEWYYRRSYAPDPVVEALCQRQSYGSFDLKGPDRCHSAHLSRR